MSFEIGDRVVSLIDDSMGLRKGEFGTVIEIQENHVPVVRWDEFNPARHDTGGLVPNGHGWYIFSCRSVDRVFDVEDFGYFPGVNSEAIGVLFGL